MNKTIESTASHAALRLQEQHPDIPVEVMPGIVARSIVGAIQIGVGLVLILGPVGVGGYLMVKGQTPTLLAFMALGVAFLAGLMVFAWGMVTIAGRLAKHPLAFVVATFGGALDHWRRPRSGP